MTGLHDYLCFAKYGYGRACAQVSVDIRAGRMDRAEGMTVVKRYDGIFPNSYAGVPLNDVLERIGMKRSELYEVIERFTNRGIFPGRGLPSLASFWTRLPRQDYVG